MAHTLDKERRQGLSSLLNIKLAEKVFQIQDHVFCTVLKRNASSIKLLTKLGYRSVCNEYWLFH
jgi:predicted GNAT family acetyltransferase